MSRATVLVALALVTLAACGPGFEQSRVEFSHPVSVKEVTTGDVEDRVVTTGSLRAPEVISLRADTSGVLRVALDENGIRRAEGDRVEAGALIAEITGEDVRIAARTEANEQRYRSAKRDYDSKQSLYDEGLISELELRGAKDALADAQLELDRSRLTERRSSLVTPIPGVILTLARDENGLPLADGQLVMQGTVIAQVAPTDRVVADVDLVGPDIARVRTGMTARIRHYAVEDRIFGGRVARVAPTVDPTTRALRAEVEIENTGGVLRPGMFVEVTLVIDRRKGVPLVPRDAITERGGVKVVFVLKAQKVERRDVVLGFGDDDIVEVRKGVEEGERVVTKGVETLSDGIKVRVSG